MEFTKDGQYFFTGSTDSYVKIWNFEDPENVAEMKKYHHRNGISCLSVGVMQISDEEAKELDIQHDLGCNYQEQDSEPEQQTYCTPAITSREVVRMGKAVLVTGGDHTVTIWDLVTGDKVNQFDDIEGMVTSVDCSPFGDNIAFTTDNKTVELRPLIHSSDTGLHI